MNHLSENFSFISEHLCGKVRIVCACCKLLDFTA
jgi:hypothetical protein